MGNDCWSPLKNCTNRSDLARSIYNTFVKEGSLYQANLSRRNVVMVKKRLAELEGSTGAPEGAHATADANLFDACQAEVLQVMTRDSFERFKFSRDFRDYVRELESDKKDTAPKVHDTQEDAADLQEVGAVSAIQEASSSVA